MRVVGTGDLAVNWAAERQHGLITAAQARVRGMVDRLASPLDVVMMDRSNPGNREGVRLHRPVRLAPREVRWRLGIPLASPVDTLLDMAATTDLDQLEAAWALAVSKRLLTGTHLRRAVQASPRRPGIDRLRELSRRGGWDRGAALHGTADSDPAL